DVQTAVQAMKAGAANYLQKPVNLAELRAMVEKAADRLRLARANRELLKQLDEKFGFEGVVGNSPKMHDIIGKLKSIAPTAATNRDLEAAVAAGTFRQDLYFRLKVVTIKLPPLRERREDLPLLSAHFIKEFNQRHGKHVTGIAEPLRKAMAGYDWPGNVRELR